MATKSMIKDSAKDLRRIINESKKHVRGLLTYNLELNSLAEAFLIHVVSDKIDEDIQSDFELTLESNEMTSWTNFMNYLEKRCMAMESIELSVKDKSDVSTDKSDSK